MSYIYHWVPKDMQGDTLFPLNVLRETHPDIYAKEAGKYAGREQVMRQGIPSLDCLWNDALHFSAVHPSQIRQALMGAGKTNTLDLEFFEIDPHLLDPDKTTVLLYAHAAPEDMFKKESFAAYDPDDIAQYSTLPQETKEYYREMITQGKRPLLFHRVPHILFKGSLDVSKIKRISW